MTTQFCGNEVNGYRCQYLGREAGQYHYMVYDPHGMSVLVRFTTLDEAKQLVVAPDVFWATHITPQYA